MDNQKSSILRTVRFLLRYMIRCRLLTLLCVLCVLLTSLSEIAAPYLLRPIINNYIPAGDTHALLTAVFLLGMLYLLGVVCSYASSRLMIRISQKTIHAIRADLFRKLQVLPVSWLDSQPHGRLMSCFTGDIDTISDALNTAMNNILSGFITFVGVIVMMIVMNPLLTLISFCFLVCMYFIVKVSGGKSRFYFRKQQQHLGALNGFIQEILAGEKVVRVTGHEEAAVDDFDRLNQGLSESTNSAQIFSGSVMPALGGTASINTAVSCCIGAVFVILGRMDLGSLVAYSQYLRQAGRPVATVSVQFNLLMAAAAGTERIMAVMDMEPECDSRHYRLERTSTDSARSCWTDRSKRIPLRAEVAFENVSFCYTPDVPVLTDLSFRAASGQKIALVGSTGAGKTTVLNLLTRFYEPSAGTITIDGIPISDIEKASLRQSFSTVLQDTHLFTGSIRDNIRFGRLDASDAEVEDAARLAGADFFISHLPEGYDTVITADGASLSAGQRQLISIARAAIAAPAMLLLDEATASVDTWTEHQIEQGLDRLMKDRTVFIIAHRLSTVRNADCILVLEHGQILERGTHAELLALKGRYYQLYTGQVELS